MQESRWLLEEKHSGNKSQNYYRDITRLEKGEPLSYVIGVVPFLNTVIDVSFRPLLPRVETEYWIEKIIKDITVSLEKKIHCLDLFAGSGCIGVSMLCNVPNATVDFADVNKTYIEQIEKNIILNNIDPARATVLESNVFDNIKGQYDYIFANPPYLSKNRLAAIEHSVLKWEPREALFAKENGLYYVKKTLHESRQFLRAQGTLYMEFDSWQKPLLEQFAASLNITLTYLTDQYGEWRVVLFKKQ